MELQWQGYGKSRDAGVRAFALLPGMIVLRFSAGETYLYDANVPGRHHVQQMMRLAKSGTGLTTYVNRFVRERYAFRIEQSED